MPSENDRESVEKILRGISTPHNEPFLRTEIRAAIQGLVKPNLKHFAGSNDELIPFVLGDTGVTREQFDAESPKPLELLGKEREREVDLALNPDNRDSREIIRFAQNAGAITYNSGNWTALHEIARIAKASGKRIRYTKPKLLTPRETALRRKDTGRGGVIEELPFLTMQRGYSEEPGVQVDLKHIISLASQPELDDHPSSVYRCSAVDERGKRKLLIRSIVATSLFGLDINRGLGLPSFDQWTSCCTRVERRGKRFYVEDYEDILISEVRPIEDQAMLRLLKARHAQHYGR